MTTNRLREQPNRVAIYGWQYPDGKAIQTLTIIHRETYVDCSHGVRLAREMLVAGKPASLRDVLRDPKLCVRVSDDGPIEKPYDETTPQRLAGAVFSGETGDHPMTMTLQPRYVAASPTMTPRRMNVIGTCGAGKTTLARELAGRLGVPHVELDGLRHGPNWTETPDPQFREMVDHALSGDGWTVDGNYSLVRDIIWSRAQTVVWLDYSFPLVMTRLLRRTVRRMVTREELWNGNRESFRLSFTSRDSILLWGLKTYYRKRREIPRLFQQPEYARVELVTLRSPAEAERWLNRIAPLT